MEEVMTTWFLKKYMHTLKETIVEYKIFLYSKFKCKAMYAATCVNCLWGLHKKSRAPNPKKGVVFTETAL